MPMLALVGMLAVIVGFLAARFIFEARGGGQPVLLTGSVIEPPRPLPEFSLLDGRNQPFKRANLRDHWSLLFFGFTNCPDVCPNTLSLLSQVNKQLIDLPQSRRPQVVFVSVDPQRDSADKVGAYARFFNTDFVGVTGALEEIDNFTKAIGVPVARVALDTGGYTVDHSGAVFAIDPDGALRALFSSPRDATELASDYRRLVP